MMMNLPCTGADIRNPLGLREIDELFDGFMQKFITNEVSEPEVLIIEAIEC